MIAGKVLMDRHAPADLVDTAQRGYDESKALLRTLAWQGQTCVRDHAALCGDVEPAQLEAAGSAEARASRRLRPVASLRKHGRSGMGA